MRALQRIRARGTRLLPTLGLLLPHGLPVLRCRRLCASCLIRSAAIAGTLLVIGGWTLATAPVAMGADAGAGSNAAATGGDHGPSVLVTLTSLEQGSVPRTVTAYGNVQAGASAQRSLMAPIAAVVDRIYVRPGEQVAPHAALIRLKPTPQTAAAYTQARTALHVAIDLVSRTRKLFSQHLASAQQLASAQKSAADARAALVALKAQGGGAPNLLRAPARAIVTTVSVSPGAIVTQGTPLLSLAEPNGLVLRVGLPPAQAAGIKAGDPAHVTGIGGYPSLQGRVLLRGALVEASSGLVPIDIVLPAGKALPGQMAEAVITTAQVSGYVVPHAAILVDDSGAPYVVQAVHMKAHKVAVRVLASHSGRDVISGPLNPTAPVVLAGNHQLHDGMQIRLAQPARRQAR